ncbi:unnamed protein product [Camellia sinensis]
MENAFGATEQIVFLVGGCWNLKLVSVSFKASKSLGFCRSSSCYNANASFVRNKQINEASSRVRAENKLSFLRNAWGKLELDL